MRKFDEWIERAVFMFHRNKHDDDVSVGSIKAKHDVSVGATKAVNACVCIEDYGSRDFETACVKRQESNPPGWVCDSSVRGKLSRVETCSDVSLGVIDEVCIHTVVDKLEKCHTIVQVKSHACVLRRAFAQ